MLLFWLLVLSHPTQRRRQKMSVRIRYKHYNTSFELGGDGGDEVTWEQIDDVYALSFVFQGEFYRHLEMKSKSKQQQHGTDDEQPRVLAYDADARAFRGLEDGCSYELVVEEDEEAGYGHEELSREYRGIGGGVGVSRGGGAGGGGGGGAGAGASSASASATAALRGLSVEDLRAQTDEYRALKEARDLEDVLFSG
jgi:hypothetical protein